MIFNLPTYLIVENGTDEPMCKVEAESQTQRTKVWAPGEKEGIG